MFRQEKGGGLQLRAVGRDRSADGTSNVEQMKQDLAAVELKLSHEILQANRIHGRIKLGGILCDAFVTDYSEASADAITLKARYQTTTTMIAVERFTLLVEANPTPRRIAPQMLIKSRDEAIPRTNLAVVSGSR
jgi:hypothetical protein